LANAIYWQLDVDRGLTFWSTLFTAFRVSAEASLSARVIETWPRPTSLDDRRIIRASRRNYISVMSSASREPHWQRLRMASASPPALM